MIPDAVGATQSQHPAPLPRALARGLSAAAAGSSVLLDGPEVHHLVHVRRLRSGSLLEVFDESGLVAHAQLRLDGERAWAVLQSDPAPRGRSTPLVVYSALPKGNRADWMVEKLAELGVTTMVPLTTKRSVVVPGPGKLQRFARIAREATKQSRGTGVMAIGDVLALEEALKALAAAGSRGAVLVTEQAARPLAEIRPEALFIGPEGGWTDGELEMIQAAGLATARLTQSILRVETAAICAAAIVLSAGC